MTIETRSVTTFTCEVCGKEQVQDEDDPPIDAWHTYVKIEPYRIDHNVHFTGKIGEDREDYKFTGGICACSQECVAKATKQIIEGAVKNGLKVPDEWIEDW